MFLLVACLLFANFLALFGFLVAAPAGEWTLKNNENSLVFVGESVCAPFCAPLQKQKTRPKSNESRTKKQRKTNTRATHQNIKNYIKKHQKNVQNGSPEGVLGGPGASWPQGRRQEHPKMDFGGLPGPKKIFGRGRGRPKTISQQFLAPLKTDTPPRYRGVPGRSAPRKIAFLLKILAPASAGCKNRGSWFLGGHSREKLKLLSTTSKLVV